MLTGRVLWMLTLSDERRGFIMFKWIKESLFGTNRGYEEGSTVLPKVDNILPTPKVKPLKGEDISEPVYAILKAWKEDPKRFVFHSLLDKDVLFTTNRIISLNINLSVQDFISSEIFDLSVELVNGALKYIKTPEFYDTTETFGKHRVYPCLGIHINYGPSWITEDEIEYLKKQILPYYKKRCERYIELIEYRKDRQRNQQNKLAQLTKQKERDRLMELYK